MLYCTNLTPKALARKPWPQNLCDFCSDKELLLSEQCIEKLLETILKPHERQVIHLTFRDGKTATETAKILGKPTSRVCGIRQQALLKLKKYLHQHNVIDLSSIS